VSHDQLPPAISRLAEHMAIKSDENPKTHFCVRGSGSFADRGRPRLPSAAWLPRKAVDAALA